MAVLQVASSWAGGHRGRTIAAGLSVAQLLSVGEPCAEDHVPLTRRELECLRWTSLGKTAWEVGRILGIAEHTAARHLHHASKKLGCVSKHQAVSRAQRLGLIGADLPGEPDAPA
jgi:DNA-binding CsgD family transcriptional regulator